VGKRSPNPKCRHCGVRYLGPHCGDCYPDGPPTRAYYAARAAAARGEEFVLQRRDPECEECAATADDQYPDYCPKCPPKVWAARTVLPPGGRILPQPAKRRSVECQWCKAASTFSYPETCRMCDERAEALKVRTTHARFCERCQTIVTEQDHRHD